MVFRVMALLLVASSVFSASPIPRVEVEVFLDSGQVINHQPAREAVFRESIQVPNATWLRVFFSVAELGLLPDGSDGAVIRLTSVKDGAVQILDNAILVQWSRSSAFFNGDEIIVELIAEPNALPSRVRIVEVTAGRPPSGSPESICGAVDDRILSSDARSARIVPVGCTGWMIDDAVGCFLSAGHCVGGSLPVVEFNVPVSSPDGSIVHPGPQDQYPVDLSSVQFEAEGTGNDWLYFGAFPNSQTELMPAEAQGSTYVLGTPPATVTGQTIRVTGYGSVDGTQGTPVDWNQVQTTHTGSLVTSTSELLQYQVDTTGGDSGAAVVTEADGKAIGIHTHAGCDSVGGENQGTSLLDSPLANALANPTGICSGGAPPLRVSLETSLPDPIPLTGTTFDVAIVDRNGQPGSITSATLVYDAGAGDQSSLLTPLGGSLYRATLPAMSCGTDVTFRVDVVATGGSTVHHPFSPNNSMDRRYRGKVAASHDAAFRDDFQTDKGWTVDDDVSVTGGSWQRGFPSGFGLRADPPWDADSSGFCFATELAGGNTDVDGGATRLTSPVLDGTVGSDPYIAYWRWWSDAESSNLDDTFTVELSSDGGSQWTTLETVGPDVAGAWVYQSFRVADFVTATNQLQLRFTASDTGGGSVIEAAVDGVSLLNTSGGVLCGLFADGFESGNTNVWSSSVP